MVNWLTAEMLQLGATLHVLYKSFKLMKSRTVDYSILRCWCVLAALFIFEEYFEWVMAWIPFFYYAKCLMLVLLVSRLARPRSRSRSRSSKCCVWFRTCVRLQRAGARNEKALKTAGTSPANVWHAFNTPIHE